MKVLCPVVLFATLLFCLAPSAWAGTAKFDFDNCTPVLTPGMSTPLDQTCSGISGHFSSTHDGYSGGGYSVQTDGTTGWHMSQFSGNYLMPNGLDPGRLDISLNQSVTTITFTFATADFNQVETPTTIQMDAYLDATLVGSQQAHGTYGSDTMPMGTLSYDSGGKAFNRIEIWIPYQPLGSTDVLVDNIALGQQASLSVLYNFTGGKDGGYPYGGLTMDKAGNLYGTTLYGGVGFGAVYKLSHQGSGWILNPLYNFAGGNDGAGAIGRMVFGPDGSLYGVTVSGGGGTCSVYGYTGCGTIFNVKPQPTRPRTVLDPWNETVLYRFTGGNDGAYPYDGDLLFDQAGNIYGTTIYGGAGGGGSCSGSNCGTVYKLSRSGGTWTQSVLYNFTGGNDGGLPHHGLVWDTAGNLYGTTYQGGAVQLGTVFQLTPSGSGWIENVLYNLGVGNEGGNPYSGVIFDNAGNLYGATATYGPGGAGSVFQLTPSGGGWTLGVLYNFAGSYKAGPVGDLVMDKAGNLYGTTQNVGGYGTAFKLTPSGGGWTYTELHRFAGASDGGSPLGALVLDASGNLYGTTSVGGTNGHGGIFKITP